MVIAQRSVLHVDLADDADADLLLMMTRDGREPADHLTIERLAGAVIILAELLLQLSDQLIDQPVRIPGVSLIGLHLILQPHHRIAIQESIEQLLAQRQCQLHGIFLLQSGEIDREHRDVLPAFHRQRLAQQEDVIAGTAAAAGLCDGQRHLVEIIFPALQRRDHLPDDQQCRIARIIMYMAEAFLHHFVSFIVKHFDMIAARLEDGREQPEVDGEHPRHEHRVRLLHLRGEYTVTHAVSSFRSSMAAYRERRRIFTAPRLSISSILICV